MSHAGGVNERGLGGLGSKVQPSAPEMSMSGHMMTFMLTCCTDMALVPPLLAMYRYRRHFEIYVGCMMLISAFAYNYLNAMNLGYAQEGKYWTLLIHEEEWHRINNVAVATYICLLAIHLACVPAEDVNIVLRYAAASLVLLAQVKDGFWMHDTCYTVYVVVMFIVGLVARYVVYGERPSYVSMDNLIRGGALGLVCGICFYFGLDDAHDEFRFAHGMSHLFGGLALTFLWRLVPLPKRKVEDPGSKPSSFV